MITFAHTGTDCARKACLILARKVLGCWRRKSDAAPFAAGPTTAAGMCVAKGWRTSMVPSLLIGTAGWLSPLSTACEGNVHTPIATMTSEHASRMLQIAVPMGYCVASCFEALCAGYAVATFLCIPLGEFVLQRIM